MMKRCNMSVEDVVAYYNKLIRDDMLPAHLFTVKETSKILYNDIASGVRDLPSRKSFKVDHFQRS